MIDLRTLRKRSGLRIVDVAELLKCSQSSIRNWEKGRTTPKLEIWQVFYLRDLYRCSEAELKQAVIKSMRSREKKVCKVRRLSRRETVGIWEFPADPQPTGVSQEGLETDRREEERFSCGDATRTLILHILTRKFGCLTPKIGYQIELLSLEQLKALSEVVLDFSSLTELSRWLQGLQEGLEEGRTLILRLLTRKFGELDPEIPFQIESLSLEQLEALSEVLFDCSSLAELTRWLRETLEE
ncbi:DUF4351 domain-containing protein [Capilliphycus salinus ALCB114379]|uniref:DUF4351 domain-containing protein n=1 Tax=Capilliphycus salinus TaxID=2768948 RepID=UPI0039A6610C